MYHTRIANHQSIPIRNPFARLTVDLSTSEAGVPNQRDSMLFSKQTHFGGLNMKTANWDHSKLFHRDSDPPSSVSAELDQVLSEVKEERAPNLRKKAARPLYNKEAARREMMRENKAQPLTVKTAKKNVATMKKPQINPVVADAATRDAVRLKRRFRAGTVALREIKKY